MKRKRVVMVAGVFPPGIGGMQSYYYNLSKHTRHRMTVLAPEYPGSSAFDQGQPFRIVRGAFMRGERVHFTSWGRLFRSVRKLMASEQPDVTIYGYVLIGFIGLLLRWMAGRRYVVSAHGMDMLLFRRYFVLNQIVRLILNRADGVLTNSLFTKRLVEEYGVDPSRIGLVYPGVEAVFERKPANQKLVKRHGLEGKYVIMTVGRLVMRKGHDRVIEAMPEIRKRIPNAVYVIVGDGPDRERLEKLAAGSEAAGAILFLGSVGISGSDGDSEAGGLNDYYSVADQFIMVSRELEKGDAEGFGIVYLEAACAGVPVIAGRSGGAAEAVLGGETGLLVDPHSHAEIVEAVVRLASDRVLRERLVRRGYQRATTQFRYESLAETFDQYVERLCKEPVSRRLFVGKVRRMKQPIR